MFAVLVENFDGVEQNRCWSVLKMLVVEVPVKYQDSLLWYCGIKWHKKYPK